MKGPTVCRASFTADSDGPLAAVYGSSCQSALGRGCMRGLIVLKQKSQNTMKLGWWKLYEPGGSRTALRGTGVKLPGLFTILTSRRLPCGSMLNMWIIFNITAN
jgi:hypothetical protein